MKELIEYLQKQIRTTEDRLRKHTHDINGRELPKRFLFVKLQKYINDFISKKSSTRLVIIPGLRGVGKTTIMAQTCTDVMLNNKKTKILFLSIDEVKALFNVGILQTMQAYEEILGEDLESLSEEIVVFLDEVQSDSDWAKSLKILHDKTSKIFFCCTGSSAVILQTTPDLARGRAIFERMTPLSFIEYQMIRNKIYPVRNLKNNIKSAIYDSNSAEEIFAKLTPLKKEVNNYWTRVTRKDIVKYLSSGSLPFTLQLLNDTLIQESISLLLDGIIKKDLPMMENFDIKTLSQVKRLLFILAENDTTSLNSLNDTLKIDRLTIAALLEALEKTELLIRIPAYGSNMSVAKKPVKYLFMSPAIRMSFFYITGLEDTYLTRRGKLLEDCVGTHFHREFIMKGNGAIRYDSSSTGADFVLQIANIKQIVAESGMGRKDFDQVAKTMQSIKADFGLIFSSGELSLSKDKKMINVPLDYFFLM